MSDWKQWEKTAQPALNLVASPDVEDSGELASAGGAAGPELFFGYDCHKAEIAGNSSEFPGCSETPETIETPETSELPEAHESLETAPIAEVSIANLLPGSASSLPGFAVPSGAVSLGVVSSGAVPPDLGERYQVLSLLGEGGMGTVWKVFDRDLQETFAVKVLRPELVADETLTKRFEKEAKLACELTHANIAAIFGPCFDKQGHPGIIMRYVDGESLAELLAREGKLSVERTTFILRQLCDALAHSHMKGIVHRDIKPSNIIIAKTEDGSDLVQLVDFGIAQSVYTKATATQALTRSVDVLGSPSYMSPEQFLGKEITTKSDIYSLGCVVYEMLTGAPPFVDENPVRLVLKHLNEAPDLLKVPESMRRMVGFWLEKEPVGRPSSFDESRAILDLELPFQYGYESRIPLILTLLAYLTVVILNSPIYCYALAFFLFSTAFALAVVNFRNASHSSIYTRLEFSFLTTAYCVFLYAAVWNLSQGYFTFLRYLVLPLFIWSNSSLQLLDVYRKLKLLKCEVPTRWMSVCKPRAALLRWLIFFSVFEMGLQVIVPVFKIFACRDFGFSFLAGQLELALTMPFLLYFLIGLFLVELLFTLELTAEKFITRIKQFCTSYIAGLSASAISLIFYLQPGMVELVRQQSANPVQLSAAKFRAVSKEVLNYPSGYYYNQARIHMATLSSRDELLQRQVCEQIIEDKVEKDYFTKAIAYSLLITLNNPYFDSLPDRQAAYAATKPDFDRAIKCMKLELAASDNGKDRTSTAFRRASQRIFAAIDGRLRLGQAVSDYLPVSSIYYAESASCMWAYAHNIAGVALSNRDFGRAREVIALARAFSDKLGHHYQYDIDDLERRLSKLEKKMSND